MATPVYQPDLSGNEQAYVLDCLSSTWISSKGPYIDRFEREFASFVGARHAATVSNGTVALHLALAALGVGPGDEVIVPTFTYIASVNAIKYVGATPVFVDSLPDTWQMNPAEVERRVTERTRAVLAVHLYGGACEIVQLRAICDRHNLRLVEDCAEAIGTTLNGIHVGTFCDIATFSFFGNKTITTGEGGMVISADAETDARVRLLRGQGLASGREYWHEVVGYNYRMTNICAAIGVAQLERVDSIVSAKRELASSYRRLLSIEGVAFQTPVVGEASSHWMITIMLSDENLRAKVRNELRKMEVETRPTFHPAHTMPMYREADGRFPIAEQLGRCGINLPSWHKIPIQSVELICATIRNALQRTTTG